MRRLAEHGAGGRNAVRSGALASFGVAVVCVLVFTAVPSSAVHAPIGAHPLTERHEFTDDVAIQIQLRPEGRAENVIDLDDASKMAVVEFTVDPGERFPWHSHPGPVFVSVVSGHLTYVYADDCIKRPYPAGTAFVDPGNEVHTAFNPGESERTVVVATFLGAPAEGPLTFPVDDDENANLNEKCGV